jgi:protein AATF/BFR2
MGGAKKRNLSVFDAIQELESEDVKAESRRRKKTTADANRGQAAQSQSKIYNHLVECRILFQRASTASNKTNKDDDDDEEEDGTVDDPSEAVGFRDECNALLETLLKARQKLILGGDDDEDEEDDGDQYSELVDQDSSSENLEDVLEKEYDTCREQWKQVLNRRHKDLKLHAGLTAKSQFRVMDSSFWEQVDATVEYEKLRDNNNNNNTDDNDDDKAFDDSKVYQQMLKDFVATSAAAANGDDANNRLSKKKKSNKAKKEQVDRRASKGRKIRYKEIPKLVNFTFPLSRPNTSNLDQDEYFQSLFGGAATIRN